MKWEIEEIDGGKKYIIRRPDRRVVVVFTFLAKPDVCELNLPELFARAEDMRRLLDVATGLYTSNEQTGSPDWEKFCIEAENICEQV